LIKKFRESRDKTHKEIKIKNYALSSRLSTSTSLNGVPKRKPLKNNNRNELKQV